MLRRSIPRDALTGLLLLGSLLALGAPAGAATIEAEAPTVSASPEALSVSLPSVSLPMEQAALAGLPPRSSWLAAGLSIAVTGSGQFYNRDSTKGWWLFGTLATYPLAMAVDAWTGAGYARVGSFTLMMAAKSYSAWDAFHTAAASASATP